MVAGKKTLVPASTVGTNLSRVANLPTQLASIQPVIRGRSLKKDLMFLTPQGTTFSTKLYRKQINKKTVTYITEVKNNSFAGD